MESAGWINDFLAWAWERHHNVLSWYIRPLFVLPLAYFSYRRSLSGIALTLVALATSMFSFPVPERVDPRVEEFLAFEREWLTGEGTMAKIATTLLVPLILGMLCLTFWRRSLVWGLVVMNAMAAGKVTWGVIDGGGTGWAMLPPALAGLIVCDAIVLYAAHRTRAGSSRRSGRAGTASAHQRKPRVRARAMGMEAEQGADVPVVGAGHRDLAPACGLRRRGVACRIIDKAVAGPALPWHDGRERGKRMNRPQIPNSGRQVPGARP